MSKKILTTIIKEELAKRNIKVEKIILFGSRARKEEKMDSDWDVYVVVNKEITFKEMSDIVTNIKRQLAELKIPNDIIIGSRSHFEKNRNVVGYISHYADKEGVVL